MAGKKNIVMADLGTGMGRELLPLALGSVTSYAFSLPAIRDAFDYQVHYLDRDFDATIPKWRDPYILAVSFYGWNKNASIRMVQAAKHAYPRCLVILGGPSVPNRPDRIAQFMGEHPYVDILVHGEGEITFAELLQAIEAKSDLAAVRGITFRKPGAAGQCVTTLEQPRITDLNIIPSPYFNGFFDDLLARYGSRITGTIFETNRGCPFSCTFCDWGSATMSKVRQFDIDRVLEEIKWMSRNKVFYAYGADANFGILFERDLKIANQISELHENTGYPGYLRICWTKNSSEKITQISDRLRKANVETMVTLSMQSFHAKTLEAIKRQNIRHGDLLKLKENFHTRGMQTYTEIILGLPEETYESFRDGLELAMTPRLEDVACIYPCSMIENADMSSTESREKYRFETRFCYAAALRTKSVAATATSTSGPREDESVRDNEDGHRFAGLAQENAMEVDEIIVGNSTMPTPEWRRSFIYGHVAWALFFYRLAFFATHYLRAEFGAKHSDFLEHFIAQVGLQPAEYPRSRRALDHLEAQVNSFLNNGPMTLPVAGYGDRAFQPNEATMTILLDDAEAFYAELEKLVVRFCAQRGYAADPAVLREVVAYQKARIPSFPVSTQREHQFDHSVPAYFDAMLNLRPLPKIERVPSMLDITPPTEFGNERAQFALKRVDKGITLKLNRAIGRELEPAA